MVTSVAFSPNGRILAAGTGKVVLETMVQTAEVILWDVASRQPQPGPAGQKGIAWSVAFSPDGNTLALGTGEGIVKLWDMKNHKAAGEPLTRHEGIFATVAFSPDGKILASGSGDKMVTLWDLEARERLGVSLVGHTDRVTSVAFAPNGKNLVSAGADGAVILWDVDVQSWISRACGMANRNLSTGEWLRIVGQGVAYEPVCPHLPLPAQ